MLGTRKQRGRLIQLDPRRMLDGAGLQKKGRRMIESAELQKAGRRLLERAPKVTLPTEAASQYIGQKMGERRSRSGRRETRANGVSPLWLAGATGLGAGLVYVLDPAQGGRRRSIAAGKMARLVRTAGDSAGAVGRDLSNRGRGVVFESIGVFRRGQPDDATIEARVRSRLGRLVSHPRAVEVICREGRVTLTGHVLRHEVDVLVRGVTAVRGVHGVDNLLQVPDSAGDIPALQNGGALRRRGRGAIFEERWSPAFRAIAGAAGFGLAAYGLTTRGMSGSIAGLGGMMVLWRSLSNQPLSRLSGTGVGRRAIEIHKAIHIEAPVDEVFDFWRDFENFPRFMDHVKEVLQSSDTRAHWTVAGPGQVPISFDTEITSMEPERLIAWKTAPGSMIQHSGVIRFDPEGDGTRLQVQMSYNPVAGAMGHAVAKLFGSDPKTAMDDDLVRFKSLLEYGKTTAHGREVTF